MSPAQPIAAADLLTIDVDAEIRKLCGRQLDSPAEALVELTRLAIQCGGRAVRVDIHRRVATVQTIGGGLADTLLDAMATVADCDMPSHARHEALLTLEGARQVGLLTLVAAKAARIVVGGPGGRRSLLMRAGRRPTRSCGKDSGPGLTMSVARRGGRREERRAIRERCSFAAIPVFLDGKLVSRGLAVDNCLIELVADAQGLTCKVGLPRASELSRTTLLVTEIVAKETVTASRRGAVHVAVVRDRLARHVGEVDERAAGELVRAMRDELYERLARGFLTLPPKDRVAARDLLLRYAEKAGRLDLLTRVPLFRRAVGDRIDVATLRSLARGRVLWAVDPRAVARRYGVEARQVMLLDPTERDFIVRALHLIVQAPPALSRDTLATRLRLWARRGGEGLGDRLRRHVSRLAGGQPIEPSRWTPEERALVRAVANELASGRFSLPGVAGAVSRAAQVVLVERGSLPLALRRRRADWCVLLPRRHPRVQAMVRAFARDPIFLYPIMTALFAGHDGFGDGKAALQAPFLARVRAT